MATPVRNKNVGISLFGQIRVPPPSGSLYLKHWRCAFLGFFFAFFDGKIMGIIGLKAPGNCSGPFWTYNLSICLWENPKTLIYNPKTLVYDFGIFGRVPDAQNLWRPQDTSTFWEILNVDNFRKDGRREMMKIRVIKSRKALTGNQYLSNTRKGKLVICNKYLLKT